MLKKIIVLILILTAFFLGMQWQKFQYDDTCLDMGGGQNPGNYPICVVEKIIKIKADKFTLDERSKKLLGPWLIQGKDWGFTLYADGTASSINAATLVYQKWRLHKDKLCLTSRSIGNHTQSVSEECESYSVKGKAAGEKLFINNTIYNRT